MEYHSIRQLEELCKTEQKPVWKIVLKAEQTETDETEKQIFERMRQMYHEMKAADEGYAAELRSASGMAGGDGEKMHRFNVTGKNLCSGYMALAMEKALKMGESNACMKRIVAAPTAGSCGVIPAVPVSYTHLDVYKRQSRSSVVWGPFSIVWGLAIALVTALLYKYKDRSNTFLFLIGTLLGGAYEYLCSVFTEIFFGKVFWDYSNIPFNLGGRINLLYCFFWGIAAVVWFKRLYPPLEKWIERIPQKVGKIITWGLLVFMCCNIMVSCMALVRYDEREKGIRAETRWEHWTDEHYDDAKMKKI